MNVADYTTNIPDTSSSQTLSAVANMNGDAVTQQLPFLVTPETQKRHQK